MDRENFEALSDEELKAEIAKEEAANDMPQLLERQLCLLDEAIRRGLYKTEDVILHDVDRFETTVEEGDIRGGTGEPHVLNWATGELK